MDAAVAMQALGPVAEEAGSAGAGAVADEDAGGGVEFWVKSQIGERALLP